MTFDPSLGIDAGEVAVGTADPSPGWLLVAPPDGVERSLRRVSVDFPAFVASAPGQYRAPIPDPVVDEPAGTLHLVVGGKDVTYFRGKVFRADSWESSDPFGPGPATFTIPGVSSLEPRTGDLAWMKQDAKMELYLVKPDGTRVAIWIGTLESPASGQGDTTTAEQLIGTGVLYCADQQRNKVPVVMPPWDIGRLIRSVLNIVSPFYAPPPVTLTGIMTRNRGSWDDSRLDMVQNLLSTAMTEDGEQWTLLPDFYTKQMRVRLRDRTTVHWTIRNGQPGVAIDLTQMPGENVIYGKGVNSDGGAWANWQFPNLSTDTAPAYPFASASSVITLGTTDADTTSGDGVSTWQARAVELGYTSVEPDGVYSSDDQFACKQIQRRYGILVDGIVGPQTWAATFAIGSNAGDLTAAFRMPLAYDPRVEPRLYSADGGVVGPNPVYDRSIVRRERDIDYGAGADKNTSIVSARGELARSKDPAWAGTITLTADPNEGTRRLIQAGQNIKVRQWHGEDLVMHIAHAAFSDNGEQVTLTVDEKARDLMSLDAILDRNRDAAVDPGRRPGPVNRRSRADRDTIVEFDAESRAGYIPRLALYGGLWTVLRIPVSQTGRIAKVIATTSSPHSKFCLALFGQPVTAAQLVRWVGNPLAERSDGYGPFDKNADVLEDKMAFIEAFGGPGQAAGYYPGQEAKGHSPTGRLIDTGGVEYISYRPPWIWVALYSPTSCFIKGRLVPAVND